MDRLDDFFKNRIDEATDTPDGWNVPSELPWEQAKKHFPKPKSNRRGLVWWFIGTAGIIVIATMVAFFYTNAPNSISQEEIVVIEKKRQETSASANTNTNTNTVTEQGRSANSNTKANANANLVTVQGRSANSNSNTSSSANANLVTEQGRSANSNTNTVTEQGRSANTATITRPSVSESLKSDEIAVQSSTLNNGATNLPLFNRTDLKPLNNGLNPVQLGNGWEPPIYSKVFPDRKTRSREFGISHKLSLFSINEIESIEGEEEIFINSDYKNINFHYTKWIGNRWSISTGLHYTNLDLKMDFKGFFDFDASMANRSVRAEYETVVQEANVDETGDVAFQFLPGLTPENGARLNIRGKLKLDIEYLQIPVMLNYYWPRPKMEYLIGLGVTTGYYDIGQTEVLLDIYEDDTIITDESQIDDFQGKEFDFGLPLQLGFKRKITPRLNLGVNLKYDFLIPIDSGIDIGIYYRWNK